ncbi:hypothetical protein CAEBREN_16861 [Caenorhabditis brenneri]|uniref:F-box domain-containing protein n=1 Tax=Caenorhabditis brenneri TaxID=135651 RepID=G0M9G2_CAEBE|nr:hypothetical protein CAEBREN_16861 [Caenorhabditis brenneri]
MPNYNQKAIEGHVYCWQTQRKPPNFAHDGLLKITNTEVWSLEDVKSFYDKVYRGEYTLEGDDAIEGFILCLYRQRFSTKASHAKMCKVVGEDEMKIEDVQKIYQKIDEGYNMELISLEGIMKLKDEKILNELDLKTRLSLRNTSKALRSLIDNGNYKMVSLKIAIEEERIAIKDDQDYQCVFRKQGDKCAIYDNGDYKLVKGAFWKRAEKALKLFLGVNNNMNIENLVLRTPEFFEPKLTFVDVLGRLNKKLKVNSLYFDTPHLHIMSHIAELLNCLDPHEIEKLSTPCYLPGFFANQIFGTEHWKNLKAFTCFSEAYYENLGDTFGHLNYAHFRPLGFPTIAQLIQLKEKLLQNRNLKLMKLSHGLERKEINELRTHFEQISDSKTPFHVVPATDQKTLSVFIDSSVVAFKGPCCQISFCGDIAMLGGTGSEFYGTLHKERNGDLMWYHFYY